MGVRINFQSTGIVPGRGEPVTMVGTSLTLGRGQHNDVCLPDPGKVISKNHCAIEDHNGQIVLVDLSTNGTFLNYAKTPVGPETATLNNGDILTMGGYELVVEIFQDIAAPASDYTSSGPIPAESGIDDLMGGIADVGGDFLDDLLGGDAPLKGPQGVTRPDLAADGLMPPLGDDDGLLDPLPEDPQQGASHSAHSPAVHDAFRVPSASAIPDDWEEDLLLPGSSAPSAQPAQPTPQTAPPIDPFTTDPGQNGSSGEVIPDDIFAPIPDAQPAPPPRPAVPPQPQPVQAAPVPETPAPPPQTAAPQVAGGNSAARAFLRALGAEDLTVPDAELDATMERLGGVLLTMITGLREILMTRAQVKSEFRIQQTMIGAGGNNPLKFSISVDQAVEAMVRPSAKGYLPSDKAAEQALKDIKAHEVAMMTAMEAALKGVLKQLSPEQLETQMTDAGGITRLIQGKKARYWDVYEKMYAKISDQTESDFHDSFGLEFARAYQAQMERLK